MLKLLQAAFAAGMLICSTTALHADSLVGGNTTVALNSGTFTTLSGLFNIGLVSPATLSGLNVSFPITADTATTISHSGGLSFTGTTTPKGMGLETDIENFVIHLDTSQITGKVVSGATTLQNVVFFDFNPSLALTLDPALAGALTSIYGVPNLSGAAIGTATVNPAPTPEPASITLMATGLAGLATLARRRLASARA